MDGTQRTVAILQRADQHAEAENVRQLLERKAFGFHLAEHGPGLLLAAFHIGLDVILFKQLAEVFLDPVQKTRIPVGKVRKPFGDGFPGIGVDLAESQFLQFLAHVLHAHAPCQRRINIHRLFGDAHALGFGHVVDGAHVVQSVGQLDQQHPHILGHRQQELAQVLGLRGFLRDQIKLFQLGQAFDQRANVLAENRINLCTGGGCVFDGVVQKGGDHRGFIQMHVGQNGRNFQRMREIRVTGSALLVAVLLHGIDICLVEQSLVRIRLVALDTFNQFVLPHHAGFGHKDTLKQTTRRSDLRRVYMVVREFH